MPAVENVEVEEVERVETVEAIRMAAKKRDSVIHAHCLAWIPNFLQTRNLLLAGSWGTPPASALSLQVESVEVEEVERVETVEAMA